MSNVTRAKTVVEALLDKTFTDAAFITLIDNITSYHPVMNLTDEEKCQAFLALWADQLKKVVKNHAESRIRRDAELAAVEAGNIAIANL